jgi:hypothetical protein
MRFRAVYVNREERFALEIDDETGRTFFSFPVTNQRVEYTEYYEIPATTFDRFVDAPHLARDLVALARDRKLDALLLFEPGSDRGWA